MAGVTRLLRRPVTVISPHGQPAAVCHRGRRLAVAAVLDCWRETGAWWAGEGERTVWRVQLQDGTVYELERERATGQWMLHKAYD